jgi:hypothetical protein
MDAWSLAGDARVMEAARHIASVVPKEQDLEGSGAWPHPLPTDHSGTRPGTVGNNLFLMGVLLSGMQAYHAETDDLEVFRSLEAGVEWVVKSWDPQRKGWPYSAAVEGEPLYVANPGLNTLVVPAIAYVGSIRNDDRLLETADAAMDAHVRAGARGDGKLIAQSLHFSSEILARLSDWKIPVWIHFAGEVRENALLRGQVALGISVLTEAPDDFVEIGVTLDGEGILTSTRLDAVETYVLDTLARATLSNEYLVWSTPLLQECEVTLYAQPMELTGGVVLAVSEDGIHWQDVPYETQVVGTSPEGWQQVCLCYTSSADVATHWLRLTLTEALSPEVQLGEVAMKGLRVE